MAARFRNEYVVQVTGEVRARPAGLENPKMATGDIEVLAQRAVILNEAKTPPFYINEDVDVDETLRLRYRYLDLRRPDMQEALRLILEEGLEERVQSGALTREEAHEVAESLRHGNAERLYRRPA